MLLETFSELFHDPAHWYFEFLVGGIEFVVGDFVLGVLLWPRIRRHIHRDIRHPEHIPDEEPAPSAELEPAHDYAIRGEAG